MSFLFGACCLCTAVAAEGGEDPIDIVLEILKSDDQEMHAAAIAMAKDMEGAEVTTVLAKELPGLPASSQVQLLSFRPRSEACMARSESPKSSLGPDTRLL